MKKLIVVFLPFILLSLFALNRIWDYFGERIEIDTTIFIRKNSGLSRIVAELENVGAVKYPILFRLVLEAMMRKRGVRYIKYGEYTLDKEDSLSSIIDKLINGRIFYRSITIPEGLSNKSIFALLEKNEFLSGEIAGKEDIAEGSLLAETYYFKREDSRNSIIERMQRDMEGFLSGVWNAETTDSTIKTKKDLLTLASIVEKESGNSSEKKLIASVFLNRLRKNMPLQSDPTAIYSYALGDVGKEKEIKTSILVKMDSSHNTYRIRGLPPTPICNPGRESIMAVLQPAKSNYLFFVIDNNGGHNFSSNYRDHIGFINSLRAKKRVAAQPEK